MRACANCGASIADDQRYCLECGGRQVQARSEFLNRFTPAALGPAIPTTGAQTSPSAGGRSTSASTIAGVGVLLLAMGVGVLIGRAGGGKTTTAPAQVISVASAGAGTGPTVAGSSGTNGASATEVPEDWSAGKSGYAVQLQTFSTSSAQASEVTAAKSSAFGKGATGVGILLSSNFTSLPADQYVVYSGDYSSETQAKQALGPLKAKFPSATVIHVSGGGSSSSGAGEGSSSSKASGGSSGASKSGGSSKTTGSSGKSSPAPSSGSSKSGQSYEQKSRSLPNVVVTG